MVIAWMTTRPAPRSNAARSTMPVSSSEIACGHSFYACPEFFDVVGPAGRAERRRRHARSSMKSTQRVVRHRERELLVEFADGTRVFVGSRTAFELSITGDFLHQRGTAALRYARSSPVVATGAGTRSPSRSRAP